MVFSYWNPPSQSKILSSLLIRLFVSSVNLLEKTIWRLLRISGFISATCLGTMMMVVLPDMITLKMFIICLTNSVTALLTPVIFYQYLWRRCSRQSSPSHTEPHHPGYNVYNNRFLSRTFILSYIFTDSPNIKKVDLGCKTFQASSINQEFTVKQL